MAQQLSCAAGLYIVEGVPEGTTPGDGDDRGKEPRHSIHFWDGSLEEGPC